MISQTTGTSFRRNLTRLVAAGAERSRERSQDILVSFTEESDAVDPLRLFARTADITSERWYWEHPDGDLAIATVGNLTASTFPRGIRFAESGRNHRQLMEQAITSFPPGDDVPGPIMFAGYSYDPYRPQDRQAWQGYQSSFLLVPRAVLTRLGERHYLTINNMAGPNRDPDDIASSTSEFRERIVDALASDQSEPSSAPTLTEPVEGVEEQQFVRTVGAAVDAIQAGEIDWLTSARRLKITTSQEFDAARAIDRLRTDFPGYRTVVASRHGSTYIGLARDALASVRDNSLITTFSLGSTRRGADPQLDVALAEHLRTDDNALERHEAARQSILDVLAPVSETGNSAEIPKVRSLDDAHVLSTRIQVRLREGSSLIAAVEALHPSPLTSGHPAQAVLEFLRESEDVDRGWFCSPFGWIDHAGNGDFVSADRAAVIRPPILEQQHAYLFASLPVTSDTDPDQHLTDSDTALATMLATLTD